MNSKSTPAFGTLALVCGSVFLSATAGATGWTSFSINDPHWFTQYWHPTPYNFQFDQLPLSGATANQNIPWSDSYWPSNRAGMAYRWKENQKENMDQDMPPSERQRLFFDVHRYSLNELRSMTKDQIANLSPLEKYSIFIGDYEYKILKNYIDDKSAQDEYWEGFCHAWAPAASHFAEPKPVVRTNRDGIEIPFGTADVKALLIANYNQTTSVQMKSFFGRAFKGLGGFLGLNKRKKEVADTPETPRFAFIGDRCESRFMFRAPKIKKGKEVFGNYIDSNGMMETEYPEYLRKYQANALRLITTPEAIEADEADGSPSLRDEDGNPSTTFVAEAIAQSHEEGCDDTNAGAFHAVITNQLGIMKESFEFDKTRDKEIWNQPAYRYDSTVLGYEKPDAQAAPTAVKVVVVKTRLYYADDTDYGWAYWYSTLTSLFSPDKNFMDEFSRYNTLLMNEGETATPRKYPDGIMDYADYQYKVELDVYGDIVGGSWMTFERPDFLWMMRKLPFSKSYSRVGEIYEAVKFPADSVKPNLGQ